MKKIITIFTLVLAFSFTANAQEAKAVKEKDAKIELQVKESSVSIINELDALVKLPTELKGDLIQLLILRTDAVSNAQTEDDKKAIFERFGRKFINGLTEDQVALLKTKPELLNKIIVYKK